MKIKNVFSLITIAFVIGGLTTSCGDKNAKDDTKSAKTNGETSVKSVNNGGVRIAYYVQDSVATQFRFYVEIDSMLKAKELDFQSNLESKYRSYQAYEADIQRRIENDEITGYQFEEIQKTALQKQQAIQQFEQQKGMELQRESMQYQIALMNKISQAGEEFSEENNIDILFFYQKGGQITYISNAFDVTESFIEYLNQREDELKLGFDKELEAAETQYDKQETGGLQ